MVYPARGSTLLVFITMGSVVYPHGIDLLRKKVYFWETFTACGGSTYPFTELTDQMSFTLCADRPSPSLVRVHYSLPACRDRLYAIMRCSGMGLPRMGSTPVRPLVQLSVFTPQLGIDPPLGTTF